MKYKEKYSYFDEDDRLVTVWEVERISKKTLKPMKKGVVDDVRPV